VWQRALEDDSNHELDWLWLYLQVETDEQRLLCLRKALHINGCNRRTRRLLEALERTRQRAGDCANDRISDTAC